MPNKSISLSGEVHISTEQVYTTVDALEALKAIGLAYGLYSRAEELRGQRVHLADRDGHTALVVQEDFSCHGSPCWETVRTLTEDPAEIQQYGLSGCAAYHSAAGSGGTAARETADRRQRPWASTQARRKIP